MKKIRLSTVDQKYVESLGVAQAPEELSVPEEEYEEAKRNWKRSHPKANPNQLHQLAVGHLAWKYHRFDKPPRGAVVVHRSSNRLLYAIIALLVLLLMFAMRAHAQYSQIQTVQVQNQGVTQKTFAAPFKLNCSTNMSCSVTGNTFNLSSSSTGSTAFSAITASANSNVGTFSASGNTWDFSGVNLFRVPTLLLFGSLTDTGISRDAAGVFDFGNGTAADKTGKLNFASSFAADGAAATPSYSFAGSTGMGMWRNGSILVLETTSGGKFIFNDFNSNILGMSAAVDLTCCNSDWYTQGIQFQGDTGLSRSAAGVIAIGTGPQGNAGGTLNAAQYQVAGSALASLNLADFSNVHGSDGQLPIWNNASQKYIPGDPIVSYNYANLLSAAVATATASTASPVRVSTFSGFGTLYVTFASITGSPSGCTIQLKNADSLGDLLNNGAAISVTPANGTTSVAVNSAAGLQTAAQMSATYACSVYPSAGTISVDYVPGSAVGIVNPSLAVTSTQLPAALDGSGFLKVHEQGTVPVSGTFWQATQPVSAASLPLPTGAAQDATLTGGTAKTQMYDGTNVIGTATHPVRTDPTGTTTQPVSGTVTANAGTGNFTVVQPTGSNLHVACDSGCSSSASPTDEGAFTQGTSGFTPIGGFYNTAITNLTAGQAGAVQLTNTRHMMVNVADALPAGANNIGSVNVANTPNVNIQANATVEQTDGTNVLGTSTHPVQVSLANTAANATAVKVDNSGVTQPVSGTVTANAGTGNFDNSSVSATGAAPPAKATYVGGLDSGATGGHLDGIPVCDSYDVVSISTATTTLEITGVSGRQVRICSLHLIAAAADNVAVIEGTGATCGTGSAGMAGGTTAASGYNFAANGGLTLGSGIGTVMRTATAGDSVCIVTSAAVQLSGGISYTIY